MRTRPLLLGHRGARRDAPENTIEAFDLCLRHACDGFEFDVRQCADGRDVICHDPKLGRREVAKSGFEELGAPCVEEVLTRYASTAFLDIELKVEGLEPAVAELLRRHPPRHGHLVSSFLPSVVNELHRIDPWIPLGLICDSRSQLARWNTLPIQAIFLERRLCTRDIVEVVHRENKQVFVWTVNGAREMLSMARIGVDGIISDDTELLAKTLASGRNASDSRADEEA